MAGQNPFRVQWFCWGSRSRGGPKGWANPRLWADAPSEHYRRNCAFGSALRAHEIEFDEKYVFD